MKTFHVTTVSNALRSLSIEREMKLNQIRTVLVIVFDLHTKPIISPAERLIIDIFDTCPEVSCLNMSSIIGKETRER